MSVKKNNTIRIGIIGTGAMGTNHLRVVDSISQYNLTCAADIDPEKLNSACSSYPIKTFGDYREMADLVDAVMISTPTESHHEIARYFLNLKKNVLVEKPIASTVSQAEELNRIADKNRLILAVGHPERFNPAVEYIGPMIRNPLFIEVQRLGSFSPRSLDLDVILDLMIHDLDLILQWDKSGIQTINASGIPIISKKIDIANVRLQFRSGLVVNMTASRVSQKKTRKLRVFQKNNYFSIDYSKQRVKTYGIKGGQIVEEIPEIPPVEPLFKMWTSFHKSCRTGKNQGVTGKEAQQALEVAIQILNHIEHIEI
jgi:predicted dehydrogenase